MILFTLEEGLVGQQEFDPPEGVLPRAVLHLALHSSCVWAAVPAGERDSYAAAWANVTRVVGDRRASQAALKGDEGPKSIVFDPVSLSWKLRNSSEIGARMPEQPRTAQVSSFLPRFRLGRSVQGLGAGPGQSKGALPAASEATSGLPRPEGAESSERASAADGVKALQDALAERQLRVEDAEGGCNVFLALARLLSSAGVEMQGLMLTSFQGGTPGSVIGAMSRKARADTKAYTQEKPQFFSRPGQWLGDHDLAAAAHLYRIRIVFLLVIYNREVKEHVYEPEQGAPPVATVHLCLDRGLFWPLLPLHRAAPATRASSPPNAPTVSAHAALDGGERGGGQAVAGEARYVEPADRRRASALDRVLHRFGGRAEAGTAEAAVSSKSRLEQERAWMDGAGFGEAIVVRGKQPATAAVVLLHGLGSTGADWEQLAAALRLPWVKFVLPTACRRAVAVTRGVMPSWFEASQGALMTQVRRTP